MDNDEAISSIANMKNLFSMERYELVKLIINENLLVAFANADVNSFADKEDNQIIEELKKKELVLTKQEN